MLVMFFFILLFLATTWILLNKNEEISYRFNIKLSHNMIRKYYIISCVLLIIIAVKVFIFNETPVENDVQAVSINENNVKGINISNNDGDIDLNSASEAGSRYVYVKATEGKTFKDSYMNTYYTKCKSLGMKVGAYHYLVSTSSPEEQAQNFYDTISGYEWDLIPMLDTEEYFDGIEDYIKRFRDAFKKLSPLELGIYSYTSFINTHLNDLDSSIYNMPLWEANYNGKPWSDVGNTKFTNLVGHQYSTKKHIGNFYTDINEFNEGCLIK